MEAIECDLDNICEVHELSQPEIEIAKERGSFENLTSLSRAISD